jgi:hypothetical protein
MLKAAALGVAGVAGAGALLNEQGGVASADLGEGQSSFSSAASPTVHITNTGTGRALNALGHGSIAVQVTNDSPFGNTYALNGLMSSVTAGPGSAAVRGHNNGGGEMSFGVHGSQAGLGAGVYGTAPRGVGVQGYSSSGDGVVGLSDTGSAVYASSGSSYFPAIYAASPGRDALFAISSANGFSGVSGHSSAYNPGYGVLGSSDNGVGVHGDTNSTIESASAVEGMINSTSPGLNSAGVRGINNGTGSQGVGVWGTQNGGGTGVVGTTPSGIGVLGSSADGTGVQASSSTGPGIFASSAGGFGVQGESSTGTAVWASSGTGTGVYGETYSTENTVYAVEGISQSTASQLNTTAVRGMSLDTTANGIGVWGSQNGAGYGVYGTVTGNGYGVVGSAPTGSPGYGLFALGDTGATGTKSAAVRFTDGRYRKLYCMESPECWFEDFGSATLRNGRAVVRLDPKFAQTVKTDAYHVFLSAEGDSDGLFISEKRSNGFVVREQHGGRSTLPFSYRVVAIRKDVKAPRFQVTGIPALATATKPVKVRRPAVKMPMLISPAELSRRAAREVQRVKLAHPAIERPQFRPHEAHRNHESLIFEVPPMTEAKP